MKQNRILTIATVAGLAIMVSCLQGEPKEKLQTGETSQAKKEMVRVMELQMQTVARSIEYPATLTAYDEVHLAPASPGRIEGIFAEVGDRVVKGAPLVQMDRTQLHQAEIQLKNLETDFARLDTLAKYGSIAQQPYDQMKPQLDITK